MIEKNFKEKKHSINKIKNQILPISIIIKRGRQINNKRSEINNNIKNIRKNSIMNKKLISIQNNIKIKNKDKENRKNKNNINISNFSSENESYSSSKERRKKFYNEDSLNYLTKNDKGYSSEEEEIYSNIKENLENNIQEILIEVYNKYFIRDKYKSKFNIKKKKDIDKKKNELKLSFRQNNKQYNFYSLKILSKKIKEILYHYREKLFNNDYLSPIYTSFKKKKNEIFKEHYQEFSNDNNHNQIISPTTSTSSYQSDSYIISQINQFNCDKNFFSSILIQITKCIQEYHVSDKIINELILIKSSLKKAVIEIKEIFQYPLSLLEEKFSIECIQLEAFNIILIKFDLLSTILYHIRQYKSNHNKYTIYLEYLNDLENDKKYERKEMTKFDKLIKEKLVNFNYNGNEDDKNEYKKKNDNSNDYNDSFEVNNNSKNISNDNKNFNNNILSSISLSDSDNNNNKNINNENIEIENNENVNNEEENNKLNDLDIDELVKFIDSDENNHKKKRKKKNKNKGKKNKKLFINTDIINNNNYSIEKNEEIERKNFEKIYEDYKKDIINNSYEFIPLKIKPKLSANWLMKLYINNKFKISK